MLLARNQNKADKFFKTSVSTVSLKNRFEPLMHQSQAEEKELFRSHSLNQSN